MASGMPFDALAKRRYLRLIERGVGRQHAAAELDMSWVTVKRHLKEDTEFAIAVEEKENLKIEKIEGALYDMALDENLGAIKEVLHNRAPHRWKDQQVLKHEISGPNGGPIQIAQAHTLALREILTDPQLRGSAVDLLASIPTTAELDAQTVEAEVVDDGG